MTFIYMYYILKHWDLVAVSGYTTLTNYDLILIK